MKLEHCADVPSFLERIEEDPLWARALAMRLLNRTTWFFRDPEVFEALKDQVLRPLVRRRKGDSPIRIWVAGCSSGEEAYSLGICLLECMEEIDSVTPCTIFGTDVQDAALRSAEAGLYKPRALRLVSPERRSRFFLRRNGHCEVVQPLRNLCRFSRHDATRQPLRVRMDLVSCRNLLIYMTPDAKRGLLEHFHQALRPDGFLLLGRSESTNGHRSLFRRVDRQCRIFARNGESRPV